MTNNAYHTPVLVEETLWALACEEGKIFVDATGGGGGHTRAILEATCPDGRVIAFDRDEEAVEEVRRSLADFGDRLMVVHANFSAIPSYLPTLGIERVDGFLFDFGVSHHQLRSEARGFSFLHDGPLDMRMDRRQTQDAATLVNEATEEKLCQILRTYGEEPRARRIARAIVTARKGKRIDSTLELAQIVAAAKGGARRRIHPATKTFQALRIAVNGELEA
ncbi:MAG: 16S rRNA (cytosine(1402)-N(4))-methyltransferase RsmH, partial [Deltaproteobacteria bacterium]